VSPADAAQRSDPASRSHASCCYHLRAGDLRGWRYLQVRRPGSGGIGYQPAIAFLAAGIVSPLATIVLILVTLFGALPVYRRVAAHSPYGEGSLAMLERIPLLVERQDPGPGAAGLRGHRLPDHDDPVRGGRLDAPAGEPYAPHFVHGHQFVVTLVLLAAVFLRGFGEAIGIAVVLVGVYLALNAVVVGDALVHVATGSALVTDWWSALTQEHSSALAVIGVALVAFPKLALGLSGFETGVLVMPQVADGEGTAGERLAPGHPRDPAPGRTRPVPPPARTRGLRTGQTQADANYNGVISQAAPRSPRWPGRVPRAW
jgi:hypothetical protein